MIDTIKIRGARQHNLKNINLDIPKNKLVVITGVSGSGKSSLAFDTIYAEGQRRYVESLSSYARQFLGIMDKPDVDLIEGLSPSISIDQKTASHNPRSTVGTVTEIYDYLRLLYARIGHPHCPNCGIEISKLSPQEITDKILNEVEKETQLDKVKPHTFRILSPVVRQKKGEFKDLFANLMSKGYQTARVDGHDIGLNDDIALIKTNKHTIEAEIDRFNASNREIKDEVFKANLRSRISAGVEQSLTLSDGLVIIISDKEHLFSEKFSCPNCNLSLPEIEPRMFSFNSPLGACESCKGLGYIYKVDAESILNRNLTINEGGILPFNKIFIFDTWYSRLLKQVAINEGVNMDIAINDLPKDKLKVLLYGTNKTYKVTGTNRHGRMTEIHETYDGVVNELERRYFDSDSNFEGIDVQKYVHEEICHSCQGKKLKKEILAISIGGQNISDICNLSIENLVDYIENDLNNILNEYEKEIGKTIVKEIKIRLTFLKNVGLAYLTLSRYARSLSGGEMQRIRLASQIGTGLTGVLYVLDEPSIGLHPKDVAALISTLHELKNLSNTLIIVEHDKETIESADYLIELGPKAGKHGGRVTFTGTLDEIEKSQALTGQYLSGKRTIKLSKRQLLKAKGSIKLRKASQNNLKNINVDIPLGNLIAVTGVSGSGKSTLVVDTLYPALKYYLDGYYSEEMGKYERLEGYQYINRVYLVDQGPIGRTPRSNPATYVGFFDDIRELFAKTVDAKARGFTKGRFSFNLKGGRCEKCQGGGSIKIEMQFLPDVYVKCDICEGQRYNKETLEVKYKGKTIFDVLKMTVEEATDFFQNHPKIFLKLSFLKNVGLGYVELGQAAPTFSGGEAQRIKLSNELSRRESGSTLYILDEPTTGLHFYDIEKLLQTLHQLVEKGNTVIVIEHNLDVIKNCQYVIDLGPEGGDRGGNIVYQGEIDGIVKEKASYTGNYLKKIL